MDITTDTAILDQPQETTPAVQGGEVFPIPATPAVPRRPQARRKGIRSVITFYNGFLRNADKVPSGKIVNPSNDYLKQLFTTHVKRDRKNGRGFSPVQLKPGTTRGNDNVTALYCFVGDFDKADTELLDRVNQRCQNEGLQYAIYSSHSSTAEKIKFRLVLFFSRPVLPENWLAVWSYCKGYFCFDKIDNGCKALSQGYYLPACPAAHWESRFSEWRDGNLFDPEIALSALPQEQVKQEPTASAPALNYATAENKQKLLQLAKDKSIDGRNNAGLYLACQLRNHGFSKDDAKGVMREYQSSTQLQGNRDPYREQAAIATLNSAYGRPAKPPFLDPETKPKSTPVTMEDCLQWMDTIEIKPIEWLWKLRIPKGEVSLLQGDPGDSKTTLALHIAAKLSRGIAPTPFDVPNPFRNEPQIEKVNTLYLTLEDSASNLRRRAEAAGGDMSRICVMDEIPDKDGTARQIIFPDDLARIETEVVQKHKFGLIFVDTIMAFMNSKLNAHVDQDVRRALTPLRGLAERTGAAVVAIRHLNKSVGGSALYRGGGSIGFTGAARSVLHIGKNPNDPNIRIIAPVKSNLGPMPLSLSYSLETSQEFDCPVIKWLDVVTTRADELVEVPKSDAPSQSEKAETIIREFLADGPRPSVELEKAVADAEISIATYKRVCKKIGVTRKKVKNNWISELPED